MAYAIRRLDGRYEIREALHTVRGPRSRTLAIFSELSDTVLEQARSRAASAFDGDALRRRAVELGAPWMGSDAAALSRRLLTAGRVPGVFAAALREVLPDQCELPDSVPPVLEWIGVDDEKRGAALREALRLADRLARAKPRPRGDLTFPSIRSKQ